MKPLSPHDLRRTARTNMARVGISDEVGEEVINHMKPSVVGVYNKYRYDKEKKDALLKWEGLLLEILEKKTIRRYQCLIVEGKLYQFIIHNLSAQAYSITQVLPETHQCARTTAFRTRACIGPLYV